MTNRSQEHQGVINWLNEWAKAIRNQDLSAGRKLFSKATCSYGTVLNIATSLDDLIEHQWRVVWKNTKDFDFCWDTLNTQYSPDGLLAVVQTLWSSVNMADKCRDGRATILLMRASEHDTWQCVHTHFSLRPKGADPGQLK